VENSIICGVADGYSKEELAEMTNPIPLEEDFADCHFHPIQEAGAGR